MVEEIRPRTRALVRPGPLANLLPVALVLWGFVGVYLLQLTIDGRGKGTARERAMQEMMYFPSGRFMRQASIEYQQLASDVVWLRAIQYYGRHLMTDRKYEWLGHVFEILTSLDPRFIGAFHFGAITLAWDAHKPREAVDLLVQGMKKNPMNWQLPFDAGFISYMLLRDYETAGRYFRVAAELPDAWRVASRWAAVSAAKAGSFDTAREMWLDIYRNTENRALRALVVRQLRSLNFGEAVATMQEAVERYTEDNGRPPASLRELVRVGYLPRIPEEPYGGRFYLEGGTVKSSTPTKLRE